MKNGRFREDLFYRLNVISLQVPALRHRRADLDHIATEYLRFFSRQCGKLVEGFSTAARAAMHGYPWPGNLRELRNVVERSVILAAGPCIELVDLPDKLSSPDASELATRIQVGARLSIEEIEKEHIRQVMGRSSTLEEAAHVLAIDPATLYRKRKQWGL